MQDRSVLRFNAVIKSEETRKLYNKYLRYFLDFVKIKEPSGLLQLKDSYLNELIEDFVIYLKNKNLKRASIEGRITALELFFAMSDKLGINWKRIKKMLPEKMKTSGALGWEREDIEKMIRSTTNLRSKAVLYLLSSTGCRIGAIPQLKIKHLKEMPDNTMAIKFYENTNSEYYGFTTPEATTCLKEYLAEREKSGEFLKPENPLVRKTYRIGSGKVEHVSLKSLRNVLDSIVRKHRGVVGGRQEVQMIHGFRKFFNNTLKNSPLGNIALKEKLMGHKGVFASDGTYHHPDLKTLWEEFRLHIGELTLDNSERERFRAERAEKKVDELESKQKELDDLKRKVANLEKLMDKIS